MQTLKHAEQFIHILHIKPHAVVPNEYHQVICIFTSASDLDFGLRARAREFDRVANKLNEIRTSASNGLQRNRECSDFPGNVASCRILSNLG